MATPPNLVSTTMTDADLATALKHYDDLEALLRFIDEPELNLHPRLQGDFLQTIGSYAAKGVIFRTHSIGLARQMGDRIYSFQRSRDGWRSVRPFEATPRYAEFLGELSFSAYNELGFERILLVEGTTDVKVARQFLRKLGVEHQVVILPLGWGKTENWRIAEQMTLKELKSTDIGKFLSQTLAADHS